MENLDNLAVVSKSLFDVRVVKQRQEIEKLRKEVKAEQEREIYIVITEQYYCR